MLERIKAFVKNYLSLRKAYQFIVKDWVDLKELQQARDMMATTRFSQNLQPSVQNYPQAKRILAVASQKLKIHGCLI